MKTATQTSPKETVMTATKTTAQQIIDDHPYHGVGFASKDAGGTWHHNAEDLEEVAGWWVFADGSAIYTRTSSSDWRDTARVAKPPASAAAPEVEPADGEVPETIDAEDYSLFARMAEAAMAEAAEMRVRQAMAAASAWAAFFAAPVAKPAPMNEKNVPNNLKLNRRERRVQKTAAAFGWI